MDGPLADQLFEPLLLERGAHPKSMGQIIGVGTGRGAGPIFIVTGTLLAAAKAAAFLYPSLRQVEDELPDISAGPEQLEEAADGHSSEAAPIRESDNPVPSVR